MDWDLFSEAAIRLSQAFMFCVGTFTLLKIYKKVRHLPLWVKEIFEDIGDSRTGFLKVQDKQCEELQKKLDIILANVQDINLRVTVVETRIEERTPVINAQPPQRRRVRLLTRKKEGGAQ